MTYTISIRGLTICVPFTFFSLLVCDVPTSGAAFTTSVVVEGTFPFLCWSYWCTYLACSVINLILGLGAQPKLILRYYKLGRSFFEGWPILKIVQHPVTGRVLGSVDHQGSLGPMIEMRVVIKSRNNGFLSWLLLYRSKIRK